MILAAVAATLAACSNEEGMTIENRDPDVIYLSGGVDAVSTTRVVNYASEFPYDDISVVARLTENTESWEDLYIDHQTANVTDKTGNFMSLKWPDEQTQHWPKQHKELQFLAYSPISNAAMTKLTQNKMDIQLSADIPDILVANKEEAEGSEDIKGKKPERDGEICEVRFAFKHILSQLIISVKGNSEQTTIKQLKITIDKSQLNKTFDLTADLTGTLVQKMVPGWSAGTEAGEDLVYTFDYSNQDLQLELAPILLFPGIEKYVKIDITIQEKGHEAIQMPTVTLSDAKTDEDKGFGLLATGKSTRVAITIADLQINNMVGTLTDWGFNGNYSTTIE